MKGIETKNIPCGVSLKITIEITMPTKGAMPNKVEVLAAPRFLKAIINIVMLNP
jgi:hypothetical protein